MMRRREPPNLPLRPGAVRTPADRLLERLIPGARKKRVEMERAQKERALKERAYKAYKEAATALERKARWNELIELLETARKEQIDPAELSQRHELAIVSDTAHAVVRSLLSGDPDGAEDALTRARASLVHVNSTVVDRDIAQTLERTVRLLALAQYRDRTEASFATLLERLLFTPLAASVLYASNLGPLQTFATGERLTAANAVLRAMSAYTDGKIERTAAILEELPGATHSPLTRLLGLLVLQAEARLYPKRHDDLRRRATSAAGSISLHDVPPLILGDAVELCLWLGRDDVERLVSGLDEQRRAFVPRRLLLAISARSELRAARDAGDAERIVRTIAALEAEDIPLPIDECADLLLGLVGASSEGSNGFDEALKRHIGDRTSFLRALSVFLLIRRERFADAHDILLPALNDCFTKYRADAFAGFYDEVMSLLALFRFVAMVLRRKAASPLNLGGALSRWTPFLIEKIASDSLDRKERLRWLEICLAMQGAFVDFEDRTRMRDVVQAVLSTPDLKGDLQVLTRLATFIRTAAQRPHPRIREMDACLRQAVESAYPTVESFVLALADAAANNNLPSYTQSVVALLDYDTRYDDLLLFCAKAREAGNSPDHQYTIASLLLSVQDRRAMVLGAETIERLYAAKPDRQRLALLVDAKFKLGKSKEIPKFVSNHDELVALDPVTAAQSGRLVGGYELAQSVLQTQLRQAAEHFVVSRTIGDVFKVYLCLEQINENQFLAETSMQLAAVAQPSRPKAAIVMLVDGVYELERMPFLSLCELRRRGYAVFSAYSPLVTAGETAIGALNAIDGALGSSSNVGRAACAAVQWFNAWDIDLAGGRAVCKGIDFFRGLEEALCCRFRRWTLDFDDPAVRHAALSYLWEMDFIVSWVDGLKQTARETGVPIVVLTSVTHSGNRFAARAYVNAVSERGDISLVASCDAYESYYNNFGTDSSTALALRNMTRHRSLAHACNAPVEEFESWYKTAWKPGDASVDWTNEILRADRTKKPKNEVAEAMRDSLEAARQSGKAIVCLFGKILFDQTVPVRGGPAHTGMDDWVRHSIEAVRGRDDVILLVKPHPHELRDDIATYPSEMLADWMPPCLPANVIVLPHRMFNLYEVAELIDLAVMWNGSSSIELGILEVPCVVCGLYGEIDYPVGHIVPRDREHYAWLITHGKQVKPPAGIADRSRALLQYRASVDVATPYRYTRRGNTNRKLSHHEWIAEDLERYRTEGDRFVTFLADRIHGDLMALRENGAGIRPVPPAAERV